MFRPLAWTKTLAVGSSSILAITLVPVLMVMLIRGRLRPERANPISRITQAIYLPVLRFCLRHRWLTIVVNLIFLIVTFPLASRLGSQFMPPLFEGSTLYMPTALPGISIEQAKVLLQQQDRILRSFPEVASVFGAVGQIRQRNRQRATRYVRHHRHAQTAGAMARWDDLRKAHSANG